MGAIVPGGQQVYIERATGLVKYTQAHSADEGTNPIRGGWSLTPGDQFDTLAWRGGLLACSTTGDFNQGPWKVYAKVKGVKFGSECAGFSALAGDEAKADAWQYT